MIIQRNARTVERLLGWILMLIGGCGYIECIGSQTVSSYIFSAGFFLLILSIVAAVYDFSELTEEEKKDL